MGGSCVTVEVLVVDHQLYPGHGQEPGADIARERVAFWWRHTYSPARGGPPSADVAMSVGSHSGSVSGIDGGTNRVDE
jgi:hypothetical protein